MTLEKQNIGSCSVSIRSFLLHKSEREYYLVCTFVVFIWIFLQSDRFTSEARLWEIKHFLKTDISSVPILGRNNQSPINKSGIFQDYHITMLRHHTCAVSSFWYLAFWVVFALLYFFSFPLNAFGNKSGLRQWSMEMDIEGDSAGMLAPFGSRGMWAHGCSASPIICGELSEPGRPWWAGLLSRMND